MLKRISNEQARLEFEVGTTIHLRYPAQNGHMLYKDAMDRNTVSDFDKFVRIFKERNLIQGHFEQVGFYVAAKEGK